MNALLFCVMPLFLGSTSQSSTLLVENGSAHAIIVYGKDDDFAAERLQQWFVESAKTKVSRVSSAIETLPSKGCVILLGSEVSNPWVKQIAYQEKIDLKNNNLTDQGYVARLLHRKDHDLLLLAGGSRDGTLYAVVDLIHWHLNCHDRNVSLGELNVREIPKFKYRWFWNWDHRMDWGGPGKVGSVMGGGGTYCKQPEAFGIDVRRCVDYMADHKFNGLILWGFLRDTHGGTETTQQLCRYAARRGVRLLPGVGTSGYAGYYFEGDHPFNAKTWLAKHPEFRAIDAKGQPRNAPCPSAKENQQWLDRGAKWLFENFEIGGVNLEMGDFFVCYCDRCKKTRAAIVSNEPNYYKDMAISHRVTLTTMRRLAPDAWLSYATYTGYTKAMEEHPPKFLSMIPDDSLCQWTLTHMARHWPSSLRPMASHNLGYLHWCNASTHTQDDFYLTEIATICRQAANVGFEGLDTYGELSPEHLNVEIAYLAWEAFLWQPEMTVEQFIEQRLGRLYGGSRSAQILGQIIPLVQKTKDRKSLKQCIEARRLAEQGRAASAPEGLKRWNRLIADLDAHLASVRKIQKARK